MNRDLTRLLIGVDQSDSPPAGEIIETFTGMCEETHGAIDRWNELRAQDLPKVNAMLTKLSLAPLTVPAQPLSAPACAN